LCRRCVSFVSAPRVLLAAEMGRTLSRWCKMSVDDVAVIEDTYGTWLGLHKKKVLPRSETPRLHGIMALHHVTKELGQVRSLQQR